MPSMARDGNESLLECRNGEPRVDAGLSRHGTTIVSELAVPAAVSPDNILEMGYGFWRSRALFSAVELGVFTTLARGALELEALKQRLGLHDRGARDFLDALVALNFLHRDACGRYGNQPDTDLYLDRHKPTYIGGLLEHLNARHTKTGCL